VKKPTNKPQWHEFQDQLEFAADGTVYGRVERFRTAWQGTFDGKPAGVGATKEEAKQKVMDAYERWLDTR
jgi:hypothetical protein